MTIEEIKIKLTELAAKHKIEEDDEFAFGIEMKAEDLILAYLIKKNIKLGDYDLKSLLEYDEEYELDRSDILGGLQLDLMNETPPFEVHPDAKELFTYFKNLFFI